jgi:hypothetical protein
MRTLARLSPESYKVHLLLLTLLSCQGTKRLHKLIYATSIQNIDTTMHVTIRAAYQAAR